MPELGEIYIKVNARLDDLERKLTGVEKTLPAKLGKVADAAGVEFKERLGRHFNNLGNSLSLGLTAPLILAGKSMFQAAVQAEALDAALAGVTGSVEKARIQKAELRKIADDLRVNFLSLTKGTLGVTAAFKDNIKDGNYVIRNFSSMASALRVATPDLDRMNVNLTQIAGQSKLTGDELKEMSAILPGLRTLLKQAFGTDQTEQLAKMGVTGKQALMAIAWEIEKGGIKPSLKTVSASIAQMENEFYDLKVEAGKTLLPIANDFLKHGLNPALKEAKEYLSKLTDEQKQGLLKWAAFAIAIGPSIKALTLVSNGIKAIIGLRNSFIAAQAAQALALKATEIQALNTAAALNGVAVAGGGKAALGAGAVAGGMIGAHVVGGYVAWNNWSSQVDAGQEYIDKMNAGERQGKAVLKTVLTKKLARLNFNIDQATAEVFNELKGKYSWGPSQLKIALDSFSREYRDNPGAWKKAIEDEQYTQGEMRKSAAHAAGQRQTNPYAQTNGGGGGGGTKKGGGSASSADQAELTRELLRAMASGIKTPDGQASCAYFASQLLKLTGVAIKTEGGAKNLIDAVVGAGGRKVGRKEARAGDLVYYYGDGLGAIDHDPNKPGQQGYHVGVYAGDGYVIDSSNGKKRLSNTVKNGAHFVRPSRNGRFANVGEMAEMAANDWESFMAQMEAEAAKLKESLEPIRRFQQERASDKLRKSGGFLMDVISVREFGKNFLDLTSEANKNRVRGMAMQEAHASKEAEQAAFGRQFFTQWAENNNRGVERQRQLADQRQAAKEYIASLQQQLEKEKELSAVAIALQEIKRRGLKLTGEEFDAIMNLALAKDEDAKKDAMAAHRAKAAELRDKSLQAGQDSWRKYLIESNRSMADIQGGAASRQVRLNDYYAAFAGGAGFANVDAMKKALLAVDKDEKIAKLREWREFGNSLAQSLVDPIKNAMVDFVKFDLRNFLGSVDNVLSTALQGISNKIINDALLGDGGLGGWLNQMAQGLFAGGMGGSGGGASSSGTVVNTGGTWENGASFGKSAAQSSGPTLIQYVTVNVAGVADNRTATQIGVEMGRATQAAMATIS